MKIANEYAWSTHSPMNKALIELFNPCLIVEMGTGLHSTPLFLESAAEKLFFIENDSQWIDHIKSNFSFEDIFLSCCQVKMRVSEFLCKRS